MTCDLGGSNEPLVEWEHAGLQYRLSVVGGYTRLEQHIRDHWYLVQPDQEGVSLLVCAERLAERLLLAEAALNHAAHKRGAGR